MSDANLASIAIQLDQKTISQTVERIVLQEIASKLGDPGAYFERVVQSCVMMKVDRDGRPSNSSYDTRTLIEHLAQRAVTEFATTVVNGWMQAHATELEKAITKALRANVSAMAKTMADVALKGSTWGKIGVTITPPRAD